jgi:hypothetical protein
VDNVIDAERSGVGVPARPPVASFVVVEEEAPEPTLVERLLGAPGWGFFGAGVAGALSMCWAASSPSGLDLTGDPFAWIGLVCVALFAAQFLAAVSRRTLTVVFLGTPLLAGLVAGAVYLELPQESRWMQAQGGFEKALRTLPTAKAWDQTVADEVVPGRIGSYWVDGVSRDAAGAAQFHLGSGLFGLVDSAGSAFTYLVDGPTAEVRDANPGATFEHLHGNWYIVRAA